MTDESATREAVQIRAFRGTRKASVYRELVLPESSFLRILLAGRRQGLALLASFDRAGPHELGKADARRLADEATRIRSSAELPELDGELTALAEVARWCARARDEAWLRIEGS